MRCPGNVSEGYFGRLDFEGRQFHWFLGLWLRFRRDWFLEPCQIFGLIFLG